MSFGHSLMRGADPVTTRLRAELESNWHELVDLVDCTAESEAKAGLVRKIRDLEPAVHKCLTTLKGLEGVWPAGDKLKEEQVRLVADVENLTVRAMELETLSSA